MKTELKKLASKWEARAKKLQRDSAKHLFGSEAHAKLSAAADTLWHCAGDLHKLGTPIRKAAATVRETTKALKMIKELREIGTSDYEIAKALDVPEDSPLLHRG